MNPTDIAPIAPPYLLISPSCWSFVAPNGDRYLDALWAKDLALHTGYIRQLTVAAPCIRGEPPAGTVRVNGDAEFDSINYVDLPPPSDSLWGAIVALPGLAIALRKAVSEAAIVHPGLAGWPIPIGWVGYLIAKWQKKFTLVVIESAPWRIPPGGRARINHRLRAKIYEAVIRRMVGAADLSFFTQEEYRHSMLLEGGERGHVVHASWINESDILSDAEANAQWQTKAQPGAPRRFLFAGRLVVEKGVAVLLAAVQELSAQGHAVSIDIIGDGAMRAECEALAGTLTGSVTLNFLEPTRYGPEFFSLVRRYDAVLVPSLSDEQPRIVYDAYSQAVPVFASDTPGLRSCVQHGVTGCLDEPGNAHGIAQRIIWACAHVDELRAMGLAAKTVAQSLTHSRMHQHRSTVLNAALEARR